jgi:hypothetical protein
LLGRRSTAWAIPPALNVNFLIQSDKLSSLHDVPHLTVLLCTYWSVCVSYLIHLFI